jgi:serine/threonine-protein kinase
LGGRYELLEIIGEGGMGTVYKARDQLLDRIVAVKILKSEFQKNKAFIEKFHTEALAAARISHPNIVSIYDVGSNDDLHYIVMEYIEGKTLKECITEQKTLPVDQAVSIAIMICDGVHHAHEKHVIHRDIKPQNILITRQGMVKVADFGIARSNTDSTITFGQNVVGSVHYVSPEQAKGSVVDCTTDIYAIGCVLYEMTTGQVPYDAESPVTVALKHIHDQPEDPRSLNPHIPAALAEIILKAMEKAPSNRFPSAEAFKDSLIYMANEQKLTFASQITPRSILVASSPSEERKKARSTKKRRKIRPLALAVMILVVLAFGVGFFSVVGEMFFGQEITVPEIVNLPLPRANETVLAVGLELNVIDSQHRDDVDKDLIISQDPVSGSKVKKGREIKVILSLGPETVTVPDVRGDKLSTATFKLQNAGLNIGATEELYDSKYEEGTIISQFPEAETKVKRDTEVSVMLSKGAEPERVSMPRLVGRTLEQAKTLLTEAGLNLVQVREEENAAYSSGYVTSQSIPDGTLVEQQTNINISVSTGGSSIPAPVETNPPAETDTTPAVAPDATPTNRSIQFGLPVGTDSYLTQVIIKDSQGSRVVHESVYSGGTNVIISISYYAPAVCEIYLNENLYRTETL